MNLKFSFSLERIIFLEFFNLVEFYNPYPLTQVIEYQQIKIYIKNGKKFSCLKVNFYQEIVSFLMPI